MTRLICFFKQKTAYEVRISTWSSDVCSSDRDSAGFAYIAVCDRVAIPAPLTAAMGATWWDTVATLSYLAAATERVRLLSHVYVLPYRHPLVVAKAWATLDVLSGGRAVLGVGAGHVEGEFEALGVPRSEEHTSELESLMRNSYAV